MNGLAEGWVIGSEQVGLSCALSPACLGIIGGIRVISFRKANKREVQHYESQSRID